MVKKVEGKEMDVLCAIEKSSNMVLVTDEKGQIGYANSVFQSVTGFSKDEVLGRDFAGFVSDETGRGIREIYDYISAGKTWRGRLKNMRKDNTCVMCNTVATPVVCGDSAISRKCLWLLEELPMELHGTARPQLDILRDETTGLLNRSGFISMMDEYLVSGSCCGALVLLNIDDFKLVTDTYGTSIGNEFLKRAARLIENTLSGLKYIAARLNHDEFAVFLSESSSEESIRAAARLRCEFEGFSPGGWGAHITASLGLAFYPEHGATTAELFSMADTAMFRAKELGRNRLHVFRSDDASLKRISTRLQSKGTIVEALSDDRFALYVQPIVDISSSNVHHYEVLARIKNKDGSILTPEYFIYDAERFGLIGAVDRVIIEKAMTLQVVSAKKGHDQSFSVNLSGKNLGDEDLLEFIMRKAESTGVDPSRFIFEITETAAVHDMERAIRFIRSLNVLGFSFSLDDFGVGFTSFVQLKELDVDYIKIDGHFVRRLTLDGCDHHFVKAITDVAKAMGIKTIAEFVEGHDTLDFLRHYGVNYAQGFLVGKPFPAVELGNP